MISWIKSMFLIIIFWLKLSLGGIFLDLDQFIFFRDSYLLIYVNFRKDISWLKSSFSSLEFDLNQVFILKFLFLDFNQFPQINFLTQIKFWGVIFWFKSIYASWNFLSLTLIKFWELKIWLKSNSCRGFWYQDPNRYFRL